MLVLIGQVVLVTSSNAIKEASDPSSPTTIRIAVPPVLAAISQRRLPPCSMLERDCRRRQFQTS
jgi:hypothetical protein